MSNILALWCCLTKNEEGEEEEGRNPVKFGRVVGSGRSRRRRRSGRRAKKGFDKVEMEEVGGGGAGDQKNRNKTKQTKRRHAGGISSPLLPELHTVSVKSVLLCC